MSKALSCHSSAYGATYNYLSDEESTVLSTEDDDSSPSDQNRRRHHEIKKYHQENHSSPAIIILDDSVSSQTDQDIENQKHIQSCKSYFGDSPTFYDDECTQWTVSETSVCKALVKKVSWLRTPREVQTIYLSVLIMFSRPFFRHFRTIRKLTEKSVVPSDLAGEG